MKRIMYQHEETGRIITLAEGSPHPGPMWNAIALESDENTSGIDESSNSRKVYMDIMRYLPPEKEQWIRARFKDSSIEYLQRQIYIELACTVLLEAVEKCDNLITKYSLIGTETAAAASVGAGACSAAVRELMENIRNCERG